MQFSVIIPIYNREHLIRETLSSVLEQEFDDYEVIVVDDGSTDQSAAVVEAYPQPVRLIRQRNMGPGVARNAGTEAAQGEYLVLLDSDDRWFLWTLASYGDAIEKHKGPLFSVAPSSIFLIWRN